MAENKVPRISIAVPEAYRAHLEDMAKEAGLTVTGIMCSMLLAVVIDNRAAHGLPALDRSVLNLRGSRA
ncbi:hypothetical protein [Mesorhizobium sp. B2-5-11]|uniref:hypothetical protein n=1 Tax=Mesorhizobium sp. B2-5-11 TaxID=2589919 RepID=UPI00112ADFF2|nr:hypothetical protein [Mesorhizobium sp. B2-5-11]TPK14143.1 hypothetical protein FJ490_02135 [Mesorhizobium sp. B2-5-11]